MNGTPPDPDFPDDIDDRYRLASALDASRPSEAVRSAVLEHAANLAAQRAGNADEKVGATVGTMRPAQIRPWRRPAIFGTLAAAALAGLLITPRLLPPHEEPRKTAAESPAPRAPAAELRRSHTDTATLAKQSAIARRVTPDHAAAAQSVAPSSGDRDGVATNAPSAKSQDLASARSIFSAPAPAAAPTQSVTVTAARRTDTAAALRQAAETGDMAALQTLLARHTDIDRNSGIDARDGSGRTALMLATLHGRRPAVEALLAAGADPNAADAHGTTPLQAAIAGGAQPEIIAALQRAGAQ